MVLIAFVFQHLIDQINERLKFLYYKETLKEKQLGSYHPKENLNRYLIIF